MECESALQVFTVQDGLYTRYYVARLKCVEMGAAEGESCMSVN